MAKPPSSVRSVRLPDALWEQLAAMAGDVVSVNGLVTVAVRRLIEEPEPLKVERLPAGPPPTWPSGALVEPHHTEDPAPKLTLGSAATFVRPAPRPWTGGHPKPGAKKR